MGLPGGQQILQLVTQINYFFTAQADIHLSPARMLKGYGASPVICAHFKFFILRDFYLRREPVVRIEFRDLDEHPERVAGMDKKLLPVIIVFVVPEIGYPSVF